MKFYLYYCQVSIKNIKSINKTNNYLKFDIDLDR